MTNPDYHYRKAKQEDVSQLKNLRFLAYSQYSEILGEENWKLMRENLSQDDVYIKLLEQATCFVCEHKDKLIGMIFLVPQGHPTDFFKAEWAYIRLLGIDPAHTGNGIGRKLTELCIEHAKQSGEKTIALHSSEFQIAARHIYECLGFKKVKELDKIYNKRYWLYTLDLTLQDELITFKRATINDLETLIDLRIKFCIELGGNTSEDVIQQVKKQLIQYFEKSFINRTSIWYLAYYKNIAVGIGGVMIREQPANFINPGGLFGYIINMFTSADFRRRKISSSILDLLISAAQREGVTAFELHATKEGEYVYKQKGFKIHHEPTYRRILKAV